MLECVDGAPVGVDTETPARTTVYVAGLWRRLAAAVVDLLCIAPAPLFLGWLLLKVTEIELPVVADLRFESILELLLEGGGPMLSFLAVVALIVMLYWFLFTVTTGSTPGLRLLRLRVVTIYGEVPQWWRALLRSIGLLVGALLLGLGLLWIGFDREKRGLHDWLAGTYVIRRQANPPPGPG
jgi:uncharacterized RDD family membrane protein YckC